MTGGEDFRSVASPREAVDRLAQLHGEAVLALRGALERFLDGGPPPDAAERARFRYPALRVLYAPQGVPAPSRRAYAKFQRPGLYETTITQPEAFRHYLLEQLGPLTAEYGASLAVGRSTQEIPYPYVFERGDEER